METIEATVGKLETQLREWGAKLDDILVEATEAGTRAKSEHSKRIDDIKAKHVAAKAKLDELKAAGTGKWEAFKTDIENAWNELAIAFTKLRN